MRDLIRLLILAVVVAGGIWFYQSRQLDDPDDNGPYTSDSLENGEQEYQEEDEDGEPGWSREERAIWRDGVNRRLMR